MPHGLQKEYPCHLIQSNIWKGKGKLSFNSLRKIVFPLLSIFWRVWRGTWHVCQVHGSGISVDGNRLSTHLSLLRGESSSGKRASDSRRISDYSNESPGITNWTNWASREKDDLSRWLIFKYHFYGICSPNSRKIISNIKGTIPL